MFKWLKETYINIPTMPGWIILVMMVFMLLGLMEGGVI